MPVTQAIGFEDAILSAASECGWSESTKAAVMLDFLVFKSQFDANLLTAFDTFLKNRVADEKRAVEADEEETCWECGGHLQYVERKANGVLCECAVCGSEQMTSDDTDEDEEDDEDDDDDFDDDEDDDDLDDDFEDDEDDFDDDDDDINDEFDTPKPGQDVPNR